MIYLTTSNEVIYKNFIINYSKAYKNKISLFDKYNNFYGYFNYIIGAKNFINKLNLTW